MDNSSVDPKEKKVLVYQLGRSPQGVIEVAKRCDKGFPQVIINLPFRLPCSPFPTVYWLTCPLLNREVAVLESKGLVKDFQESIARDDIFKDEMLKAQEAYRNTRESMLDKVNDLPANIRKKLKNVGVGGVSDLLKVKCLHAHFAQYLATGLNPIGKKVGEIIGKVICDGECEVV